MCQQLTSGAPTPIRRVLFCLFYFSSLYTTHRSWGAPNTVPRKKEDARARSGGISPSGQITHVVRRIASHSNVLPKHKECIPQTPIKNERKSRRFSLLNKVVLFCLVWLAVQYKLHTRCAHGIFDVLRDGYERMVGFFLCFVLFCFLFVLFCLFS